jgi:TRAP-type transport system large permease protein
MSTAFTLALVVLAGMAAIGAPIALSMVVSAVAYLLISGQDLSLASEQFIQSVYDSTLLLAVPLFIVAATGCWIFARRWWAVSKAVWRRLIFLSV